MKRNKLSIAFMVVLLVCFIGTAGWAAKTWKNMNLEDCTIVGTLTNDGTIPIVRVIPLSLVSAWLEGVGPIGIDGTTTPGINTTALDGIYGIVYADSLETASIGWTFTIPPDYSSGLAFRMMVSSSSDVATEDFSISWELWVNKGDTAFDAAAYGQTAVGLTTLGIEPVTSNEILTFTADATALTGIAIGDIVTVLFGNDDTRSGAAKTTEIKSIEARYNAKQ